MTTQPLKRPSALRACEACGAYNVVHFSRCSGCGVLLTSAAASTAEPTPVRAVPAADPTLSSAPCWPIWASSDEQRMKFALAGLSGFAASRFLFGADRKTGIAVDESSQQVCIIVVGKDAIKRRLVAYTAINESQIVVAEGSGDARQDENRPEERVVASSTAERVSASPAGGDGSVENIRLKLFLGEGTPLDEHEVNLLAKTQNRGSAVHRAAVGKAKEWHSYMVRLMHLPSLLAYGGQHTQLRGG